MTKRKFLSRLLTILIIGSLTISCASTSPSMQKNVPVAQVTSISSLDALLREYAGPGLHVPNPDNIIKSYYFEYSAFEEVKIELDSNAEYYVSRNGTGKHNLDFFFFFYAIFKIHGITNFELEYLKDDGNVSNYIYKKHNGERPVLWSGLEEILKKYTSFNQEKWDDGNLYYVYYLDPIYFDNFKEKIEESGKYLKRGSWTEENRSWDRGVSFVRWVIGPNGIYRLDLMKEDNSVIGYEYKLVN